jgi:hypothetical protein
MGKVAHIVRNVVRTAGGPSDQGKRDSKDSASIASDVQKLQSSHSMGAALTKQRQPSVVAPAHVGHHGSSQSAAGALLTTPSRDHLKDGAKRHSFSGQHGMGGSNSNSTASFAHKHAAVTVPSTEAATGPSGDFVIAAELGTEALYTSDAFEMLYKFIAMDSSAFVIDRQF